MKENIREEIIQGFDGEFYTDSLYKAIFATDASVYRNMPEGVAFPKHVKDIQHLVKCAVKYRLPIIPRAAGTSLAGQCVGEGLVVDVSRHMNKILAFDETERTVTVEPGVIRDELNDYLKPFGLFFGPNTSTSNRCMIGGMVGNNSSGTTSIKYGVTRDKVVRMKAVLSDGSIATFESLGIREYDEKVKGKSLEGSIYSELKQTFEKQGLRDQILKGFPKEGIHRRNNGYAIDDLTEFNAFGGEGEFLNLGRLLSGSEGTLAFTTEITLSLDLLPPPENVMVAAHFTSIRECMEAVVIAMRHNLYTCELMDKTILDCTRNNREHLPNRFFVEGDPEAILMLELCNVTLEDSIGQAESLIDDLKKSGHGYAYPILKGKDIDKALNLRKAGLGLLGNIVGDDKAVACIEDTAVEVEDLPSYIGEFSDMMEAFGQKAVYYAHAGAGELHLRPILNLKKSKDVELFREITTKTAALVKKYGGSFSGEHGDGIVRSEFIPFMVGEKNYELMRGIKNTFDPQNIFNPGKIIDPYKMDKRLRYIPEREEPEIETVMDFSDSQGILRAAEKCNGSGDCRKLPAAGGTMCPSYRATRDEKDTTRARANALREFLTSSNKVNRFDHKELYEVFELCLSCKACARECPSNVDIASMKAEFLHQYYLANGVPMRTKLFAENAKWNKWGSIWPGLTNFLLNTDLMKSVMGIASQRTIPKLQQTTLKKWLKRRRKRNEVQWFKQIWLFIDEYTDYYDVHVGIAAIELLEALGYEVLIADHDESGRSYLSKGLLNKAKQLANINVSVFRDKVSGETPLVGIEPSAILSFRDEYPRLAEDKKAADSISKHTYTFEEFIAEEFKAGHIESNRFVDEFRSFKIHGHCQQKSLSSMEPSFTMLSIPENYTATIMNTGCCGMAGAFGYEKEHYEISMKVGEDTLFPRIRKTEKNVEIVASGTSCRHQIQDGTNRQSRHPIEILKEALII